MTASLALFNARDVWGYEWASWTYRSDAMDIQGNFLTREDPLHPNNTVWNAQHASRLGALQPTGEPAGSGFASTDLQRPLSRYGEPIEFALSSFTSTPSGLAFSISSKVRGKPEQTSVWGGLSMTPGQMHANHAPSFRPEAGVEYIRVSIADGNNDEVTTPRHLIYMDTPGVGNVLEIVSLGSTWAEYSGRVNILLTAAGVVTMIG